VATAIFAVIAVAATPWFVVVAVAVTAWFDVVAAAADPPLVVVAAVIADKTSFDACVDAESAEVADVPDTGCSAA
jgi:hypothetical protein